MTPCALSLDVCDPLQWTTCQSSQPSSQLSFAVEERHSPWLTAPPLTLIIFHMSSWSGNKMRTREGSNQDARLYPLHRNYWIVWPNRHSCSAMDGLCMEHGVLEKCIKASCFYSQGQSYASWNGFAQNILGKTESSADWRRAIPFIHVQMGRCSFTELRVWCLWANCRPHHFYMPPTSCTKRNTRSVGPGWWHPTLA